MKAEMFKKAHERDVTGMVAMSLDLLDKARTNASKKGLGNLASIPQALVGVLGYFAGGIMNEQQIFANNFADGIDAGVRYIGRRVIGGKK